MTSRPVPTVAPLDGASLIEVAAAAPVAPRVPELRPLAADAESRLTVGYLVAGKYRLTREIGHGGMGAVWEAVHEALGSPVAVKFLKPWSSQDASLPSRFVTEARIVASIKHRFVVGVFDFGVTEDGLYYMVLELLVGGTLAHRLDVGPRFRAHDAVNLIADCLRGLHAVHEAGVVHRDLKPENIFVVSDGDGIFPKLIDFGISKRAEPVSEGDRRESGLTEPGVVVGTLAYMPPEQLRGRRNLDRRADVYSMGVITYELLVGRTPYAEDNVGDLMVAIMNEGPPPLSRLRPELGSALAKAIAKALAREPAERFATALELRDALLAALPAVPVDAMVRGPGSLIPSYARGHETELQLKAAAATFGSGARSQGWRRRGLWLGGALLVGLLLLGGLWLSGSPAAPVTSASASPRIDPAPAARAPEAVAAPMPVAPAQAQDDSAAKSAAARSPSSASGAREARRELRGSTVSGARENRRASDMKRRRTTSKPAPAKKIYRDLDF